MSEILYKQKYLKYKQKYLELKNLIIRNRKEYVKDKFL